MLATKGNIQALKKVRQQIQEQDVEQFAEDIGEHWDWDDESRCTVGLFIRFRLDLTEDDIEGVCFGHWSTPKPCQWKGFKDYKLIMESLAKLGVNSQDIYDLELGSGGFPDAEDTKEVRKFKQNTLKRIDHLINDLQSS